MKTHRKDREKKKRCLWWGVKPIFFFKVTFLQRNYIFETENSVTGDWIIVGNSACTATLSIGRGLQDMCL